MYTKFGVTLLNVLTTNEGSFLKKLKGGNKEVAKEGLLKQHFVSLLKNVRTMYRTGKH